MEDCSTSSSNQETSKIAAYYRDGCGATCITLSLASISGQTKNIFLDAASTLSFSSTVSTSCNSCGSVVYTTTYTPSSATANLILGSTSTSSITFAASNNLADKNTYTVTVQAMLSGLPTTSVTATASYSYIDPCSSATITFNAFPVISTSVLVSASSNSAIWYDSVSGSAAT